MPPRQVAAARMRPPAAKPLRAGERRACPADTAAVLAAAGVFSTVRARYARCTRLGWLAGVNTQKNLSFLHRLRFALAGLGHALRSERSLRTQAAMLGLVLLALIVLRPGALWWAAVLLASAAVLAAELFNTALEALVDHLHPDQHPRIRIVKDCAAAAVLIASLGALAVGVALALHLLGR